MLTKKNPKMAGLVLVGTATLVLAGCSMGGSTTADETMEPTTAPSASEESMETEAAMDPAYDNLVGAGCAMYDEAVPDGAGSIVGMSQDPVAVAASKLSDTGAVCRSGPRGVCRGTGGRAVTERGGPAGAVARRTPRRPITRPGRPSTKP